MTKNFFTKNLSPENYARDLRFQMKLHNECVDLQKVCDHLNIELIEDDLGETGIVSGCLLKENDEAAILVNKHINYYGKKRFTIGHEIGHFILPWHEKNNYSCRNSDIETFKSDKEEEFEANIFAAELLFPTNSAIEILKKQEVSMTLVKRTAENYGLSLCATAKKLVEQTKYDTCALVLSSNNKCLWRVRSPLFYHNGLDIRCKGITLPTELSDNKIKGTTMNWIIGNNHIENIPYIWEEHLFFSKLNIVLSIISVPDNVVNSSEFDETIY